jgi:hypothetical protein
MSLPKLNPVEPPWYGPVCPVVGEGWHREVSPYPDRGGGVVICPNSPMPESGISASTFESPMKKARQSPAYASLLSRDFVSSNGLAPASRVR